MAVITQIVEKIVELRCRHQIPTTIFMSAAEYHRLVRESPQLRLYSIPDPNTTVATVYGIPIKIGEPECLCGEVFTEEHGKHCFVCHVKGIPEGFIKVV